MRSESGWTVALSGLGAFAGRPDRLRESLAGQARQSAMLGRMHCRPDCGRLPGGIWYHHVTEAKLARIVEEHLRGGVPVEEYIFHRLSDNPHAAWPKDEKAT